MVLNEHVPDEVADMDVRQIYRERFPNYCSDCGGEVVVAGGRVTPSAGWYEHLDPVLTCAGCGRQTRHTAGVDQSEGHEWRVAPGADAERNADAFAGVVGHCDIHGRDMVPTKALRLDGRMMRQFKCPVCDREAVVAVEGESE